MNEAVICYPVSLNWFFYCSLFMSSARPRPNNHPLLLIIVVGGVTCSEVRSIRDTVAGHHSDTQVTTTIPCSGTIILVHLHVGVDLIYQTVASNRHHDFTTGLRQNQNMTELEWNIAHSHLSPHQMCNKNVTRSTMLCPLVLVRCCVCVCVCVLSC